jgi:hypothetical protein
MGEETQSLDGFVPNCVILEYGLVQQRTLSKAIVWYMIGQEIKCTVSVKSLVLCLQNDGVNVKA